MRYKLGFVSSKVAIPAARASQPPNPDRKIRITTKEHPKTDAILRVLASAEAQTLCHIASEKMVEAPRDAPSVKMEIQPDSLTPRFGGRGFGRGVLYRGYIEEHTKGGSASSLQNRLVITGYSFSPELQLHQTYDQ
jgi:hypothetical protein